jgi:hypothetical protein
VNVIFDEKRLLDFVVQFSTSGCDLPINSQFSLQGSVVKVWCI